jgi:hypothetical protein
MNTGRMRCASEEQGSIRLEIAIDYREFEVDKSELWRENDGALLGLLRN